MQRLCRASTAARRHGRAAVCTESAVGQTWGHWIPFPRSRLLAKLVDSRELLQQISLLNHLRCHKAGRAAKKEYLPFDPDTGLHVRLEGPGRAGDIGGLLRQLGLLATRANFTQLGEEELREGLKTREYYGLNIGLPQLDQFDVLQIWWRGEARGEPIGPKEAAQSRTVNTGVVSQHSSSPGGWWRRLKRRVGLTEPGPVPVYVQLLLVVRQPGSTAVHLKMLQQVPKHQLELVMPQMQLFMTERDVVLMLSTAGISVAGLLLRLPGFTIDLMHHGCSELWSNVAGPTLASSVCVIIAAQVWQAYQRRVHQYADSLYSALYYRSMSSNHSVIQYLNEEAEAQELKEAWLAWHQLNQRPLSAKQLQLSVDGWLTDQFGQSAATVSFDTADAIYKLREFELLASEESDRLEVVSVQEALRRTERKMQLLQSEWSTDENHIN